MRLRIPAGIAVLLCSLTVANAAFTVDGTLNDWGTWVTYPKDALYPYGEYNGAHIGLAQNPSIPITFWSPWTTTDGYITAGTGIPGSGQGGRGPIGGRSSGGEQFDIEGLYMNLEMIPNSNQVKTLNWAIVTSFNELGDGTNGSSAPHPDTSRFSPVIAMDFDGALGTDGLPLYNYALVLDSGDYWNGSTYSSSDYSSARTRYLSDDITATPQLWSVTDPRIGFGWSPAATEFGPTGSIAPMNLDVTDPTMCATTGPSTQLLVTGNADDSVRRLAWITDADGNPIQQYTETFGGVTNPMIQLILWRETRNWIWEGQLDVSKVGLNITRDVPLDVHYAMYCGNDWVTDSVTLPSGGPPSVPEPSLAALLLVVMVPVGAAWRKRKKRA